jgi:predicted metal-dependent hydrolase
VPRVPDDYAPTAEQALADGRRFLAEGMPFHAHEVFEGRWKCAPEEERELWQGLAQICVGLTHLQRGNGRGALTLFARGAARVQASGGAYDAVGKVASGLGQDSDPGEAIALILEKLPD